MSRLALSDSDKLARDWFVKTTKALGCDVQVDAMGIKHLYLGVYRADIAVGNIFAVRPGRKDGPPTFAGKQHNLGEMKQEVDGFYRKSYGYAG